METIPFDVAIYLALIALAIGAVIGAALARRKRHEARWVETRFDRDLSHLPELHGRSSAYFQHGG